MDQRVDLIDRWDEYGRNPEHSSPNVCRAIDRCEGL